MAKRDSRSKRSFRSGREGPEAAYPTLERFDCDRRGFLAGLGAALGLGAVGAKLMACGGSQRRVSSEGADGGIGDGSPQAPDMTQPEPTAGVAPAPDAMIDRDASLPPPAPDADWPTMGDVPAPDARVDPDPDWGLSGGAALPDTGVDKPDTMMAPGYAPAMDARIDDSGSCPNP